MKKFCESCGTVRKFKPFRSGLFRSESGETVYTCKQCGHLRTVNQRAVREPEIIHKPTQKKFKELEE